MAYLYAGLSYYALNCNDKEVIDFLLLKSNEFSSNGKLEYELTEVDQVPIGIMYINLYKISRNKEFLDVARSVFDYLNEKRINGSNLISYRAESANQLIQRWCWNDMPILDGILSCNAGLNSFDDGER